MFCDFIYSGFKSQQQWRVKVVNQIMLFWKFQESGKWHKVSFQMWTNLGYEGASLMKRAAFECGP